MADGKRNSSFVKCSPNDVEVYTPPGHSNTFNRRLIGWSSGAEYVEVILGEMIPGGNAERHAHENFEQAMYMLEGELRVVTDDAEEILKAGELCFFPKGVSHKVECLSKKARYLVIYAPPKEKFDEINITVNSKKEGKK